MGISTYINSIDKKKDKEEEDKEETILEEKEEDIKQILTKFKDKK